MEMRIDEISQTGRYLYHGTTVLSMAGILEDNRMHTGLNDGGPPGVSLTFDSLVAASFASYGERTDIKDHLDFFNVEGGDHQRFFGCVLKFDINVLESTGQLPSEFDFSEIDKSDSYGEKELRTNGPLLDVVQCLDEFTIHRSDINFLIQMYDSPYKTTRIMQCANHPKCRIVGN